MRILVPGWSEYAWLTHGFGLAGAPWPPVLTTVKQIHSNIVLDAAGRAGVVLGEADALLSDRPGVTIGVKTADCVPILLLDPQNRRVAAIHAGWRGSAGEISRLAVEAMASQWGSEPTDLRAAIGPSIGVCCYQVGPEVARRFGTWCPEMLPEMLPEMCPEREQRERPVLLDLKAVNQRQLALAGVRDIFVAEACTFCGGEAYDSFRRQGALAGRMMSFIGVR